MKNIPPDLNLISALREELAEHHHEFGPQPSKRAKNVLEHITHNENGEALPDKEVTKNIMIFGDRVRALLPQLRDNPKWQGRAASEEEFQSSHGTLHKSMQRLLGTPITRMAYSRNESAVRNGDLSTLVIDLPTITPKLLENLGLHEYKPPKGMRREQQPGHMARAIPEIRAIISELKPFRLTHEGPGNQKKGYRLYVTPDGFVVGIQSNNGVKHLYRTDIHGAYRRIDHIRDNYNGEIRTLKHIQSTIARVAQRVRSDWPKAKEDMPEIQKEMLGCVDTLRFVEDRHKQQMRQLIQECISFETVHHVRGREQKRYNPGSRLAKLVTIPNYVGKRIRDVESIRGYLEQDQVRVKDYIETHQAPVEDFYNTVERLHEQFDILDPGKKMSPEKESNLHKNLDALRRQCEPASPERENYPLLQPYSTYAHAVAEHVDATKCWLTLGSREKAREEFLKIYVVAKIQHSYVLLQDFYEQYLSPHGLPDFDKMMLRLDRLKGIFWNKRVAPETTTMEYNEFWGKKMGRLLNGLKKDARAARDASTDKERQKIKEEMRQRMRTFRFEDIASGLVA